MDIIQELARRVEKNEAELKLYLNEAPKKYKVYKIPKRSHGFRVIAQPAKQLKTIQRAFLEIINFPVHHSAYAYQKKISIKDNATLHSGQKYFLKMDFENFFNSINRDIFWSAWEKEFQKVEPDNKIWIEKIIFWCPSKQTDGKMILSVGAPCSPMISNFCLLQFDKIIYEHCQNNHIFYSRYADDLTFSSNIKGILFTIPPLVKELLKNIFNSRISINNSKTAFSSMAHNRHVTGITITNEGYISLGRDRKRYIKHLVHQYNNNHLKISDIHHLKGLLSFAKHIEPRFIASLEKKYTPLAIQKILSERLVENE